MGPGRCKAQPFRCVGGNERRTNVSLADDDRVMALKRLFSTERIPWKMPNPQFAVTTRRSNQNDILLFRVIYTYTHLSMTSIPLIFTFEAASAFSLRCKAQYLAMIPTGRFKKRAGNALTMSKRIVSTILNGNLISRRATSPDVSSFSSNKPGTW